MSSAACPPNFSLCVSCPRLWVVMLPAGGAKVLQINGTTRDLYYYPKVGFKKRTMACQPQHLRWQDCAGGVQPTHSVCGLSQNAHVLDIARRRDLCGSTRAYSSFLAAPWRSCSCHWCCAGHRVCPGRRQQSEDRCAGCDDANLMAWNPRVLPELNVCQRF